MRLPRYESYQQPDDDWLGELPEHWNVRRTKTMFTLQKTKVGKASADYTLLSLTLGGVIVRDMAEGGKLPAEFDAYQVVEPDDLVFCLFDIDETPRTIGIAHNHGMITGAYSVYRALPSCVPEYACYYFLHLDSFKGLRPFYSGLRKVVRADTFSKVTMPAPPVDEQKQIATFLDYETAKIDALIEKQQQLIALLGEKRQAVISHAVTKGLNPDAPMRDSGIEWLGEVPEHWEFSKVKHHFSTCSGGTPNTGQRDKYYAEDQCGVPWIRTTDLNNDFVTSVPIYITDQAIKDTACSLLPEGTVMLALYGGAGTVGKNGLLTFPASINQAVCGLLPSNRFENEYVFRYMQFYRPHWMVGAESSRKDPNISQDEVKNAPILRPPQGEQVRIVAHLRSALTKYNTLTEKAEGAVELLQERRTALISAAVTGKIDVRGWKPPSSGAKQETEMEVA